MWRQPTTGKGTKSPFASSNSSTGQHARNPGLCQSGNGHVRKHVRIREYQNPPTATSTSATAIQCGLYAILSSSSLPLPTCNCSLSSSANKTLAYNFSVSLSQYSRVTLRIPCSAIPKRIYSQTALRVDSLPFFTPSFKAIIPTKFSIDLGTIKDGRKCSSKFIF